MEIPARSAPPPVGRSATRRVRERPHHETGAADRRVDLDSGLRQWGVDFSPAYAHGFARGWPPAHRTVLADPAANAALGAADRPGMPRRGRRGGDLPGVDAVRLLHRGHLLRTACSTPSRRHWVTSPWTPPTCCRCWWSARPAPPAPDLQHRGGDPPAGVRVAVSLPADLSGVLRAPPDGAG